VSSRGVIGRRFLASQRVARRARAKAFSVLAGGAFAAFGRDSVIEPPVRIDGPERIAIGNGVFVGRDSWLHVEQGPGPVALQVGDGTSIVGHCVLSAARSVRLGRRVLVARGVYVSDHSHAFADRTRAVLDQGIDRVAAVTIGDGAWLGENVVVCPGVSIGAGAVIGANSVVTRDVPPHAVAVGAPARVVTRPEPAALPS
jgi:acetyltransferase-like isoleucine patch superfamily enzyme